MLHYPMHSTLGVANKSQWNIEADNYLRDVPKVLVGCKKDLRNDAPTLDILRQQNTMPTSPYTVRFSVLHYPLTHHPPLTPPRPTPSPSKSKPSPTLKPQPSKTKVSQTSSTTSRTLRCRRRRSRSLRDSVDSGGSCREAR